MKMNKKFLTIGIISIFSLMLITGAVLQYFAFTSRDVVVSSATEFSGDSTYDLVAVAGETSSSEVLTIQSKTSVNAPLLISTSVTPDDAGITNKEVYVLSASGSPGTESKVYVDSSDTDVVTLDDLDSIEWDVNVKSGYIAHVDVRLGNGEALVFEYAKVQAPCDNTPYPTGELNTFGDKGIVDNNAKAWLSSGVPGYCGLPAFDDNHKTLADWKTMWGDVEVTGFDFEIDNWISDSSSDLMNIKINSNPVEVTLKPMDKLSFRVDTTFGLLNEGDYTIETTASPRV